jgi:hypothetical protein
MEKVIENQLDMFNNIETLNKILQENNIKKLTSIEEIEKYFNINILDEDNTPQIVCENKVLIIFDNENYNETYLLDIVLEYLSTHSWLKENIEIIYIDNFDLRVILFAEKAYNKFWAENNIPPHSEFEKNFLTPGLMTINPIEKELSFYPERLTPLVLKNIESIFVQSKLEE